MASNNFDPNYKSSREKPHIIVQIFLALYAVLWMGMLFLTAMSSLYLGHIDYGNLGYTMGLTFGLYFVLKYF